jgi:hypothetical protein
MDFRGNDVFVGMDDDEDSASELGLAGARRRLQGRVLRAHLFNAARALRDAERAARELHRDGTADVVREYAECVERLRREEW